MALSKIIIMLFGAVGFNQPGGTVFYTDFHGNWDTTEIKVASEFYNEGKSMPGTIHSIRIDVGPAGGADSLHNELSVRKNMKDTGISLTLAEFGGVYYRNNVSIHYSAHDTFSLESFNHSKFYRKIKGIQIQFEPDPQP